MNITQIEGDEIQVQLDDKHTMRVDLHTWNKRRMYGYKWKLHPGGYAHAHRGCIVLAHRLATNAQKGQQVDHIDGDRLNNRADNLRFSTQAQNCANRKSKCPHGFKGITLVRGAWSAMIMHDGKRYYMGRFKEQSRAAEAYDRAALALSGEFAALNFEEKRAKYRPKFPRECQKRVR
jgi:hypothetical protein